MGKDLSNNTNNDGKIAPSELGILMRSLGGNPTQAQLDQVYRIRRSPDLPLRFPSVFGPHVQATSSPNRSTAEGRVQGVGQGGERIRRSLMSGLSSDMEVVI
ncbi:hypothetical protein RHSIM_Rhsim07G0151500 [Rhododendron simsii]|uniref:EF-hand domain-containing protein n=1 Tax=Rhododendron simsii TaxID=118357 RepID=A0A834GNQ0_RHOSS|nr:hypothetical protein RHSIM_Rhsim07G0151500 [Rhododendron simsii]